MELSGRVSIVTGAAQGIGRAIAEYLYSRGSSVVLADINLERTQLTLKEINSWINCDGGELLTVSVDVSDADSVLKMAEQTIGRFGRIDILVNNAGLIDASSVLETTIESWDRVVDVDLRGVHLCSQVCIPYMIEQRYGRIINIASMAGQIGGLKVGPGYTAAKAGVIGLAKSYARFGAAHNITANSICPGFIETEATKGRDDPSSVPIGRLGTPLDVAKAVFFFASDLGDYVTGCNINVNGGLYMGH